MLQYFFVSIALEKNSALSAVATQYVYRVLGLKPLHPLSEEVEEKILAGGATVCRRLPTAI